MRCSEYCCAGWNQREDRSAGSHVQLFSLLDTWTGRKVTVVIPLLEGYCIVNISVLPVISQWDGSFKMEHRHNIFALSFRAWLDSRFAGSWMGRRGLAEWPRGSPDLNSMRFMFVLLGQKGRPAKLNEVLLMSYNSNFEIRYLLQRNYLQYVQSKVTKLFP